MKIMAEVEGTPLVLDDALGNTDTERLKTMGAVLARCAQEVEIIIFTCMPSRYSDVGAAKVVTLPLHAEPKTACKASILSSPSHAR